MSSKVGRFPEQEDRKHGLRNAVWASYYTLPGGDNLQFAAKFDGDVLVEGISTHKVLATWTILWCDHERDRTATW